MDFKAELKKRAAVVERALEKYLPPVDAYPSLIHRAMRYSTLGGGKRLRPVLAMAAAEAAGGSPLDVLPAACALELIHTYSLIHDDLPSMDNDDYRRGKLTSHKVFGEAVAVLAGDALLTFAFELLSESKCPDPERVVKVIGEVATGAGTMGLIGGQVVDTFSAGEEINEETIEYIHRHKTGALYRVSVRTGAILAGASEKQLASLTGYSEHLGLAFQIIDDILDIEGDEKKLGKPVGSDQKNKKVTYPSLFGIEKSRVKAKESADAAVYALNEFGREADFMRELVQFVIERDF